MTRAFFFVMLVCTLFPVRAAQPAQVDSTRDGIHFIQGLGWKDILAKAKRERKYIFVDCFATWCGPCKRMDREVYSRKDVGDNFNSKFISVRAQMDTSRSDDELTQAFYSDAHFIGKHYDIQLFPTLLFFNPDGNIVDRISGGLEASDFLKAANEVVKAEINYYVMLERYKKGERDLDAMSYLARMAIDILHDTLQSEAIAKEYFRFMSQADSFSVRNIQFLKEFTNTSLDPGFAFFYQKADSIDKIMRAENYSEDIVHRIIYSELVNPEFSKCKELKTTPDWNNLSFAITGKYNQYYADRIVLGAKADWNASKQDWEGHTRNLILFIEKYGPTTDTGGRLEAAFFNNCAWDIFVHSSKSSELDIALKWSLRAVTMDPLPDWMDTYANILYKMGRKSDALKWEGVAAALAPGHNQVQSNYESMKAGKPTW